LETKILLGISACLLGKKVRYDGKHKEDRFIIDRLGKLVEFVPVCPEWECGLGVPREVMRLIGDPEDPRMVTIHTKGDHTERMKEWSRRRLSALNQLSLGGFIVKSNSPSCGLAGVDVYDEKGTPAKKGVGLFTREFLTRFQQLPVIDEIGFHNKPLREKFIEQMVGVSQY
jgi:uncharacterized protein YbbK (DUF523 family)